MLQCSYSVIVTVTFCLSFESIAKKGNHRALKLVITFFLCEKFIKVRGEEEGQTPTSSAQSYNTEKPEGHVNIVTHCTLLTVLWRPGVETYGNLAVECRVEMLSLDVQWITVVCIQPPTWHNPTPQD